MRAFALLLAGLIGLTVMPALAVDYTAGSIKISDPWSRATPKGATIGAGYMKITNSGTTPDRLIGGSSGIASSVEVHEMTMSQGVARMRPVSSGLEIKPGQTVEFKPSSYHLMFVGLNKQLAKGDQVKATLQFEKAGKVDVTFDVESVGAQAPTSAHK